MNLIVGVHRTKSHGGKAATVLSILVGAEQANENFHGDAHVFLCIVAVVKFCNSDASVLGLPCREAGRNLDFAFLTVGANALDHVFNDFVASVILTVAGKEFSKGHLEFLHVVAYIARIGPHFNAVCLDGNVNRGHGASDLERQFVGVLVELDLGDGHGGVGGNEHHGRIGRGGDEQGDHNAGAKFDLIDPPRHAFGLHDGSNTDHQHNDNNGKTPCSALEGENRPEENRHPTGQADFGSKVGRSTGRPTFCKEACIVCWCGSSSLDGHGFGCCSFCFRFFCGVCFVQ